MQRVYANRSETFFIRYVYHIGYHKWKQFADNISEKTLSDTNKIEKAISFV